MKLHKSQLSALGIIVLSWLTAIYFYPQMPSSMASHWNALGQVDGYLSKFWGLLLLPLISTLMLGLFLILPKIDPLKANVHKFRSYFDNFILIILVFMYYLYILTLVWNLGWQFNFVVFLVPAFALIYYYASILLAHTQPNWFIGIKTPWTLSSPLVWQKTHQRGAKIFKVCAFVALLGLLWPKVAIWLTLLP